MFWGCVGVGSMAIISIGYKGGWWKPDLSGKSAMQIVASNEYLQRFDLEAFLASPSGLALAIALGLSLVLTIRYST
jgi:hypothetical protein